MNAIKTYYIVLDPSGDIHYTGRSIGDSFERAITLQCAEKIKEYIETKDPHYKVIITRLPGETMSELQTASLSNKLNADLCISLNFYYSQETKLFIYQCAYNDVPLQTHSLCFIPYDQAYLCNKSTTDHIMNIFNTVLRSPHYAHLFQVSTYNALPLKQIIGITAPSFVIEAGIKHKDRTNLFVEPLASCILQACNENL
jgi:hypothetical protein